MPVEAAPALPAEQEGGAWGSIFDEGDAAVLLELDGDHLRHWINGALALSAFVPDGGQALGQRGLILGADFQTNGDCAAQVAEVIVFRRALTPAERGPLVWALRSRYGL